MPFFITFISITNMLKTNRTSDFGIVHYLVIKLLVAPRTSYIAKISGKINLIQLH